MRIAYPLERACMLPLKKSRGRPQTSSPQPMRERLLGRGRMGSADDCARYFQSLLASEPAFAALSVEHDE